MKKPKKTSRLFERFMDEYTGKAEARRVKEAAKANRIVDAPGGRMPHVRALEQENAVLRAQLAQQQHINVLTQFTVTDHANDFEREYARPEPVVEEEPKGRKIVLNDNNH